MSAGEFATARRGGLTLEEIREIEAHRNRERPTPWQALAARYGRPVSDIQSAMESLRPSQEPTHIPESRPHFARPDRLTAKEPMMRQLWAEGMGVADISRTLGIGQSSVSTLRARLRLPSRASGNPGLQWTPAQDEIIRREYIVAGRTSSDVAAMIGVSRGALVGRVNRLGWAKHSAFPRLTAANDGGQK